MLLQASEATQASSLNVGDFILDDKGKQYEVIQNIVGDMIFLLNRNSSPNGVYDGFHLFYDDEYSEDSERIARVKFNLELA